MSTPEGTGATGAPPLPMALRAIAAWLESHPEVAPSQVHLSDARFGVGPVKLRCFGLLAHELPAMARAIGGTWTKDRGEVLFTLAQDVAPGIVVELTCFIEDISEPLLAEASR